MKCAICIEIQTCTFHYLFTNVIGTILLPQSHLDSTDTYNGHVFPLPY